MTGTDPTRTGELQDRYARAMMPNYGVPPVALAIGKGCQVWDADGREYTDLIAGIAVSALGHAHPALTSAVSLQVAALAHTLRDKTEAAYNRTDLFDRRRDLMEAWTRFVTAKPANVVSIGAHSG